MSLSILYRKNHRTPKSCTKYKRICGCNNRIRCLCCGVYVNVIYRFVVYKNPTVGRADRRKKIYARTLVWISRKNLCTMPCCVYISFNIYLGWRTNVSVPHPLYLHSLSRSNHGLHIEANMVLFYKVHSSSILFHCEGVFHALFTWIVYPLLICRENTFFLSV